MQFVMQPEVPRGAPDYARHQCEREGKATVSNLGLRAKCVGTPPILPTKASVSQNSVVASSLRSKSSSPAVVGRRAFPRREHPNASPPQLIHPWGPQPPSIPPPAALVLAALAQSPDYFDRRPQQYHLQPQRPQPNTPPELLAQTPPQAKLAKASVPNVENPATSAIPELLAMPGATKLGPEMRLAISAPTGQSPNSVNHSTGSSSSSSGSSSSEPNVRNRGSANKTWIPTDGTKNNGSGAEGSRSNGSNSQRACDVASKAAPCVFRTTGDCAHGSASSTRKTGADTGPQIIAARESQGRVGGAHPRGEVCPFGQNSVEGNTAAESVSRPLSDDVTLASLRCCQKPAASSNGDVGTRKAMATHPGSDASGGTNPSGNATLTSLRRSKKPVRCNNGIVASRRAANNWTTASDDVTLASLRSSKTTAANINGAVASWRTAVTDPCADASVGINSSVGAKANKFNPPCESSKARQADVKAKPARDWPDNTTLASLKSSNGSRDSNERPFDLLCRMGQTSSPPPGNLTEERKRCGEKTTPEAGADACDSLAKSTLGGASEAMRAAANAQTSSRWSHSSHDFGSGEGADSRNRGSADATSRGSVGVFYKPSTPSSSSSMGSVGHSPLQHVVGTNFHGAAEPIAGKNQGQNAADDDDILGARLHSDRQAAVAEFVANARAVVRLPGWSDYVEAGTLLEATLRNFSDFSHGAVPARRQTPGAVEEEDLPEPEPEPEPRCRASGLSNEKAVKVEAKTRSCIPIAQPDRQTCVQPQPIDTSALHERLLTLPVCDRRNALEVLSREERQALRMRMDNEKAAKEEPAAENERDTRIKRLVKQAARSSDVSKMVTLLKTVPLLERRDVIRTLNRKQRQALKTWIERAKAGAANQGRKRSTAFSSGTFVAPVGGPRNKRRRRTQELNNGSPQHSLNQEPTPEVLTGLMELEKQLAESQLNCEVAGLIEELENELPNPLANHAESSGHTLTQIVPNVRRRSACSRIQQGRMLETLHAHSRRSSLVATRNGRRSVKTIVAPQASSCTRSPLDVANDITGWPKQDGHLKSRVVDRHFNHGAGSSSDVLTLAGELQRSLESVTNAPAKAWRSDPFREDDIFQQRFDDRRSHFAPVISLLLELQGHLEAGPDPHAQVPPHPAGFWLRLRTCWPNPPRIGTPAIDFNSVTPTEDHLQVVAAKFASTTDYQSQSVAISILKRPSALRKRAAASQVLSGPGAIRKRVDYANVNQTAVFCGTPVRAESSRAGSGDPSLGLTDPRSKHGGPLDILNILGSPRSPGIAGLSKALALVRELGVVLRAFPGIGTPPHQPSSSSTGSGNV